MKIAFLGDSVLDNFYWLEDQKRDVKAELTDLIILSKPTEPFKIRNFAVDESTVKDVLHGMCPRSVYSGARKSVFEKGIDSHYPVNKDGIVKPLNLVRKYKPTHAVLSIGGNDGRVHLSKLLWSAESLIDAIMIEEQVPQQVEKLIQKLLEIMEHNKLILVFVYKPHKTIFEQFRNQLGYGMQYLPIEQVVPLGARLDKVYSSLRDLFYTLAKKYKLPIIDLSRTFDCENRSHYGSTVIEPSNLSGKVIARLIEHVINEHNFEESPVSYYAPNCGKTIRCESIKM